MFIVWPQGSIRSEMYRICFTSKLEFITEGAKYDSQGQSAEQSEARRPWVKPHDDEALKERNN